MEHVRGYRKWTGKGDEMPAAYRGMSYILFRTDSEGTEILGRRCPDPARFAVGTSFLAAMGAETEIVGYLSSAERLPLFLEMRTGVGMLLKEYDLQAGIGVYLQIHESPEVLGRLLWGDVLMGLNEDFLVSESVTGRGGLRRRDEAGYGTLLDAWTAVANYRREGGLILADGQGAVSLDVLEKALVRMGSFAGVQLQVERLDGGVEWGFCYRPVLLEALLLCLLTEAGSLSAEGDVVCRVGASEVNRRILLELSYPIEPKRLRSEDFRDASEARCHLERVADLGGLALHEEVRYPSRREYAVGALPRMEISLEWLRDPTLLVSGDLKADLRLLYGNMPR